MCFMALLHCSLLYLNTKSEQKVKYYKREVAMEMQQCMKCVWAHFCEKSVQKYFKVGAIFLWYAVANHHGPLFCKTMWFAVFWIFYTKSSIFYDITSVITMQGQYSAVKTKQCNLQQALCNSITHAWWTVEAAKLTIFSAILREGVQKKWLF